MFCSNVYMEMFANILVPPATHPPPLPGLVFSWPIHEIYKLTVFIREIIYQILYLDELNTICKSRMGNKKNIAKITLYTLYIFNYSTYIKDRETFTEKSIDELKVRFSVYMALHTSRAYSLHLLSCQ